MKGFFTGLASGLHSMKCRAEKRGSPRRVRTPHLRNGINHSDGATNFTYSYRASVGL